MNAETTTSAPDLRLRVLNGRQSQAEAPVAAGANLIGNDAEACDIVVDLGTPERHLACIRRDATGLVLVPMAGDAWLGERHLEAHAALPLPAGTVFTLGRVSMAVAAPGFDFDALALPQALRKAGDRPELAAVALPRRSAGALRATSVLRGALIATCAITVAAALVWGSGAVSAHRGADAVAGSHIEKLRASLAASDWPELAVRQDETQGQVVVEGYVPDTEAVSRLERQLGSGPRAVLLRVHAVQPLAESLARRFAAAEPAAAVHYGGQGRFTVATASERVAALTEVGERAMKDLSGVRALDFELADVLDPAGQRARVSLARSPDRLGQFELSGHGVAWKGAAAAVPRFVEVRWGELPSVLTRQGERLFAGATLPDGSVIRRIEPEAVVVARAGVERIEPVGGSVPPR